ncbi:hypothetical protein HDV00_006025 [Rhizophlyctis rosea]|nr:hypothetical protein HDV00_006025 [Rhizophlyctis rosea]
MNSSSNPALTSSAYASYSHSQPQMDNGWGNVSSSSGDWGGISPNNVGPFSQQQQMYDGDEDANPNPLARVRRVKTQEDDGNDPEDELVALLRQVRGVKLENPDQISQVQSNEDPDAIENLLTYRKDQLNRAFENTDPDYHKRAFDMLRQYAALGVVQAGEVLASEFLPYVKMALQPNVPVHVQAASLRVVQELMQGPTEHTTVLVEDGFIPLMATLFKVPGAPPSSRIAIIQSFTMAAYESQANRDAILALDILPPLLSSLGRWLECTDKGSALVALECLRKLVYWKDPDWEKLQPLFTEMKTLLESTDGRLQAMACEVAQSLLQNGMGKVGAINGMIDAEFCANLIKAITSYDGHALSLKSVVGCFMCISERGNIAMMKNLVEAGLLRCIYSFMWNSALREWRLPGMTIVANVLRYPIFLDKVIYYDLFDFMARCLGEESHYSNFAAKKEAVWAISNAAAFRRPDIASGFTCLGLIPNLIRFMTQSYEMDLQATSRAIETINHILVTGELFKTGGAAHRGTTNPYADEMSESTDSVPTLMTLYCLISGRGLEGLEEGESMVGEEDEESDEDEEGEKGVQQGGVGNGGGTGTVSGVMKGRHVPIRERVAGKIRKVLLRWFIPKMTRLVDEGQWASPIVAAPLNDAEMELLDALAGKMQGVVAMEG